MKLTLWIPGYFYEEPHCIIIKKFNMVLIYNIKTCSIRIASLFHVNCLHNESCHCCLIHAQDVHILQQMPWRKREIKSKWMDQVQHRLWIAVTCILSDELTCPAQSYLGHSETTNTTETKHYWYTLHDICVSEEIGVAHVVLIHYRAAAVKCT